MQLDTEEVKNSIPHRHPFLFVDRVVELVPGESIVAVRVFGPDEPFFEGHFPGFPVVPGVIIVEALAQAGGILIHRTDPEALKNGSPALVALDSVKFRSPVRPGDEVTLEVAILRTRPRLWKLRGRARVGDKTCAQADITATVF